jgi:hypothetical protein
MHKLLLLDFFVRDSSLSHHKPLMMQRSSDGVSCWGWRVGMRSEWLCAEIAGGAVMQLNRELLAVTEDLARVTEAWEDAAFPNHAALRQTKPGILLMD